MCQTPLNHIYMWHDSFIHVTWLIHTCDMTHSYMWHDSFIRVTWLTHVCDMPHSTAATDMANPILLWRIHVCVMSRIWVSQRLHIWMSHNRIGFASMCASSRIHDARYNDASICASRLTHMVWHDSFHSCNGHGEPCSIMTHPCVRHDPLVWCDMTHFTAAADDVHPISSVCI